MNERLFEDYINDRLSPEDKLELAGLLRADGTARRQCAAFIEEWLLLGSVAHELSMETDAVAKGEHRRAAETESRHAYSGHSKKHGRRRWGTWISVAACLIAVVGAALVNEWQSRRMPELIAAKLVAMDGNVRVVRNGKHITVILGMNVLQNDIVRTEDDGTAMVGYEGEESSIELQSNTEAKFFEEDDAKRVRLAAGTIGCNVAPQPAGKEMVLATPHARAMVVGTIFTLKAGTRSTRLEVEEGRVMYTGLRDGTTIEVSGGYSSIAGRGIPLVTTALVREQADAVALVRAAKHVIVVRRGRALSVAAGQWLSEDDRVMTTAHEGRLALESRGKSVKVELHGIVNATLGARWAERASGTSEASPHDRHIRLEQGRLNVKVFSRTADIPFVAETPHARVEALDALFELGAGKHTTEVEVLQGTVTFVRSSDGRSVEVAAGAYGLIGDDAEFLVEPSLGRYKDGKVIFREDFESGLDNWECLVRDETVGFRLPEPAERKLIRLASPPIRTDQRSTWVMLRGKSDENGRPALRLKKSIQTAGPMVVEYTMQAVVGTVHICGYGTQKACMNRYELGTGAEYGRAIPIRVEFYPLGEGPEGRRFEKRLYLYGELVSRSRITTEGDYIQLSSGSGTVVYDDLEIREMEPVGVE